MQRPSGEPRSIWEHWWQAWKCQLQAWKCQPYTWEHGEFQLSSLGKTCSIRTLLVHLEIIATTYHLTILNHMYSVCILIYVAMYLYSCPSTRGISGLAAGGAWAEFEVCLKITIKWTQRYTLRQWSSKFGDTLGGRDTVNSEMHLEAEISDSNGSTLSGFIPGWNRNRVSGPG